MATVTSTQKAVVRSLNDIKNELQYDIDKLSNMIERIEVWSDKQAPEAEYDGEYGFIVLTLMTSLLNTSGHISSIESAISYSMKGSL
jgi:hypothetical protein